MEPQTILTVNDINNIIDKGYQPQVGDILSNNQHSLMIVERVYSLDRTSLRVNRNYNEHLTKHEWLQKVIQRKEIIWDQHKLDFDFFPEKDINKHSDGDKRKNTPYHNYCYYNDFNQYQRLYGSKYWSMPDSKIRVITGQKTMVRIHHGLCRSSLRYNYCRYGLGLKATPLSSLIAQKSVYQGNIYSMIENRLK